VTFSPNGRMILASFLNSAKLFDVRTGRVLQLFDTGGQTYGGVISPDGKKILTGSLYGTATIWDIESGKKEKTVVGHKGLVNRMAFSPDGKLFVTSDGFGLKEPSVMLWDSNTVNDRKITRYRNTGHYNYRCDDEIKNEKMWNEYDYCAIFPSIVFSPDGKEMITEIGYGRYFIIWGTENSKYLNTVQTPGRCLAVYGDTLALFEKHDKIEKIKIHFLNIKTRTQEGSFSTDYYPWNQQLYFNRERMAFWMTGNSRNDKVSLRYFSVLNVKNGKEIFSSDKGFSAVSQDVKKIASTTDYTDIKILDASTGQKLLTIKDPESINTFTFSPDAKLLATGYKSIKIWNTETGEMLLNFNKIDDRQEKCRVIMFSSDGGRLLSLTTRGIVKVWNSKTGKNIATINSDFDRITSDSQLSFSPDGRRIVSEADKRKVKIWDAESGKELMTIGDFFKKDVDSPLYFQYCSFSPDGKRLVIRFSQTLIMTSLDWRKITTPEKLKEHKYKRYLQWRKQNYKNTKINK